jgi:hemerythrin-like domain-containing protein
MKSTEFLIHEHKLILRALDVLDALCGSVEKAGELDQSDADMVLDFLRWFADAHHQAKEETILFPALKNAAAAQAGPIEHMRLEHNQERELVEDIEAGLRLAQVSELVADAARLGSTLRNHIYKEDRILFETADAVLSQPEDQALLDRLTRFDTALDKQILETKLKDLHALEWKYLRK